MKRATFVWCLFSSLIVSSVCYVTGDTLNPLRPVFLLLGTLVLSAIFAWISPSISNAVSELPFWGRYVAGAISGVLLGIVFTFLTLLNFWVGSWPSTAGWVFGSAIGLATQMSSHAETEVVVTWKKAFICFGVAVVVGLTCGMCNPLLTN
jgi:hypothetical protein